MFPVQPLRARVRLPHPRTGHDTLPQDGARLAGHLLRVGRLRGVLDAHDERGAHVAARLARHLGHPPRPDRAVRIIASRSIPPQGGADAIPPARLHIHIHLMWALGACGGPNEIERIPTRKTLPFLFSGERRSHWSMETYKGSPYTTKNTEWCVRVRCYAPPCIQAVACPVF